ncbi:MAG: hypothetical protein K2X34_06530 [Hyphomonadaceae bacterium]|nr:hypothetical protein [Hyphomonadaceae bacterium]
MISVVINLLAVAGLGALVRRFPDATASFLKNAAATALMICIATVSSVTFGAVLALFVAPQSEAQASPEMAGFAVVFGGLIAAVVGMLFCVVTLLWALLTMPPTIWLIRKFDLPRPAADMIGGGVMGLLCAMMGSAMFSDIKGSDVIPAEGDQTLAVVGLLTGCTLAYVRHALLVRGRAPEQGLASAA